MMNLRKLFAFCLAAMLAGCTSPITENPAALPVRPKAIRLLTMTEPRALQAAVTLHDGRVLICGGTSNANIGGVLASAEIFDPATATFSKTSAMTAARQGQTATMLPDGTVLI